MIIFDKMLWVPLNSRASVDHLGFIPSFFSVDDPRPAAEQVNEKYIGSWHPQDKFTVGKDFQLLYPEDPPMPALWVSQLRDETIRVYPYGYVMITQKDGSFEVSRLD